MSISQWVLKIELHLEGPILTAGGELAQPGIDAAVARDSEGRCLLPFSLVKGRVLEALRERRVAASTIVQWLGRPSSEGDWEPNRGRLRFTDFLARQTPPLPSPVIERVQIGESGTAARRMLQMIEAPFGYGEQVVFDGQIEFLAATDDEAQQIEKELTQALRSIGSFGADRTIGFGVNRRVAVSRKPAPVTQRGGPRGADSLPWRLRLDRPLCLVGRRVHDSHFESTAEISGAVLKGAVAQLLRELAGGDVPRDVSQATEGSFAALRLQFTNVQFTEARPCRDAAPWRQPVAIPLSVALPHGWKAGSPWFDMALEEGPRLLPDPARTSAPDPWFAREFAPEFAPDWKDWKLHALREVFGWSDPPRERRTRTAIDGATGRAADQQLFSYGLVQPGARADSSAEGTGFVWQGRIELGGIPQAERDAVRRDLQALLQHGLPGLGKTKATAEVEWLTGDLQPAQAEDRSREQIAVVTLQTECLMTNPALLEAGTEAALRGAYEDFWNEASQGAWTLERFFARQVIRGGFVARRGGAGTYRPFLLTDRGSVFVLKPAATPPGAEGGAPDEGRRAALLAEWRQRGLPTPRWVEGFHGRPGRPLWETCVYLRENGYGEVAVNLACHFANRPTADASAGGRPA